ncbi:hypothetical protein BGZ59_002332 [Podila verticillata]|nr:hypothetical protein BGZ59_002332 [Podila verticillata]
MAEQSKPTPHPRRPEARSAYTPPSVLIAGAGLGGLLLAILLEHAKVPYRVLERASSVKPIGAALSLNANVLSVLEQIHIYDDLMKVALPCLVNSLYDENLEKIADIDQRGLKDLLGYYYTVFPRPALYALMLTKIPQEKILFNKKVVSLDQTEESVTVQCADGTAFNGDILVGADGAYSGVRQCLYEQLSKKDQLPASDAEQMCYNYMTMVGTTGPLDPDVFPKLGGESTTFSFMLGTNSPYSWSTLTMQGNRACWSVKRQLDSQAADNEKYRNAEWSPEANQALIDEVRDFKTPHGNLGRLIEHTPKESISRVFLEDKLFETWFHGRTVLIGDGMIMRSMFDTIGISEMLPSAGQGAVNALQDAVILANCIYDMTSIDQETITETFNDFREQRYEHVKFQFERSKVNGKLIYGQTWTERLMRHVVFNYLPKSFLLNGMIKDGAYRPQVMFMPRVSDRGRVASLPQKPSKRYTEQQESDSV